MGEKLGPHYLVPLQVTERIQQCSIAVRMAGSGILNLHLNQGSQMETIYLPHWDLAGATELTLREC